jgi:hypothetical protein
MFFYFILLNSMECQFCMNYNSMHDILCPNFVPYDKRIHERFLIFAKLIESRENIFISFDKDNLFIKCINEFTHLSCLCQTAWMSVFGIIDLLNIKIDSFLFEESAERSTADLETKEFIKKHFKKINITGERVIHYKRVVSNRYILN